MTSGRSARSAERSKPVARPKPTVTPVPTTSDAAKIPTAESSVRDPRARRPASASLSVEPAIIVDDSASWAESEASGRGTHVAGHLVRGRSALANGHGGEA